MNRKLPTVLESATLFDTFFSVRKDRLLYPDDSIGEYYVLNTVKESVAIIATTKTNEVLVTREYRHAANKVLLGCPGGLVDPGESFLKAAQRELLEETGCKASDLRILGTPYPLPGILEQKMAIVHAKDVTVVQRPELEAQELIEWQFLSIDELKKSIACGQDVDAILCTAFLFYLLTGL
jgi:ADP-ribose diphosphatase